MATMKKKTRQPKAPKPKVQILRRTPKEKAEARKRKKLIKCEFGRQFRKIRDDRDQSRAELAARLGISPKTIQSWEMGRTFLEDLSLIPALEAELGITLSDLINLALASVGGQGDPNADAKARCRVGPLPVHFDLHGATLPSEDKLADAVVAVPLVSPEKVEIPVAELKPKDIQGHILVPADQIPRGSLLVATRMGDSSLDPMVPLGGIVVIDRRNHPMEFLEHRFVAFQVHDRGMRLRRLERNPEGKGWIGLSQMEESRGTFAYAPEEKGDRILGHAVLALRRL